MADAPKTVAELRGLVATVCLSGSITPQFGACLMELRSYMETRGMRNVEYKIVHGLFVESARDDVVKHSLQQNYDWTLQIDADATFSPDTLHRLLEQAYVHHPDAGVMGAYCQLKAKPNLPTIDTGTGTWEEHYPGEGVLLVIRTGAHCFLIKNWIFQRLGPPPWFRSRQQMLPAKAFKEVDNFARCRVHGKNPLADHSEWATLMEAALAASPGQEAVVGEDSAFFDRCRAHNIPVYVDCDLVTGHVAQTVIYPNDFSKAVKDDRRLRRIALGAG